MTNRSIFILTTPFRLLSSFCCCYSICCLLRQDDVDRCLGFPYPPLMPKRTQSHNAAVLYARGAPRELAQKLKAAAALHGKTLQAYLLEVLQAHVQELERKGILPKGK